MVVFLHKAKSGQVVADLMSKASAKIGSWPACMLSDGAAEYDSPEVRQLFLDNNIEHEWSNAGEQFQDGTSETLVNTLGRGVCVLLLFSRMAPEFWGLSLLHVANVYNYLPHLSLHWEIPYALQFNHVPDISWFQTFGCSAVVWQGCDLVDHGKLAPQSESGVFVGLGLMHCCKAWLVYSARTNRVYDATSVTFDETLFQAKAINQRIYCYYYNAPVNQFRADMHEHNLNSTIVSDLPNLSSTATPVWTADDVLVDENAIHSGLSGNMSGLPEIESSPINVSSPQPDDTSDCGRGSNKGNGVSDPGGGDNDDISAPGGGDRDGSDSGGGSLSSGPLPAGELQPFPNARKHKGKRQRFGDKVPPL
eukprot:760748-Rhodomonas_salina.1